VQGLAVGRDDTLYLAATDRVLAVRPGGLEMVAGGGAQGSLGDGALATAASFHRGHLSGRDRDGHVYAADPRAHRLRRFTPGGLIATGPGRVRMACPATAAQPGRPTRAIHLDLVIVTVA
jgi:hypothetical protein